VAAGDLTPGKRFPDGEYDLEPGGYAKHVVLVGGQEQVQWWISTPTGTQGMLIHHEVVENEDGTITVDERPAPRHDPGNHNSILTRGGGAWHGYIDSGVWREV